jgi:hypothetical protein
MSSLALFAVAYALIAISFFLSPRPRTLAAENRHLLGNVVGKRMGERVRVRGNAVKDIFQVK